MTSLSDKLDEYFALVKEIHDEFGYKEDWVVIPLDDQRGSYWQLSGEGRGHEVTWATTPDDLRLWLDAEASDDPDAWKALPEGLDVWSAEIYTQRFLPKWVYRTDELTMVCVDTHTDGNKFLMIFDNAKEVKL